MDLVLGLFFIVVAACLGGLAARALKLPSLVGYIVAGIVIGAILPPSLKTVSELAQIGIILLLFSVGIELSFDRLSRYLNIAVFGALIQMFLVTVIVTFILGRIGFPSLPALVLALGFSVSSTAILVKILGDRGEEDTIHGEIMFGWSLTQDLIVIPVMVILPLLAVGGGGIFLPVLLSLGKAFLVILGVIFLGKIAVPYFVHLLAGTNSRELLLLSSIAAALGTAAVTSYFGISPALGAFLAGVVISESQENHAVFAEIRPLRDLFVALFFVTLGFLVIPSVIIPKLGLIIVLTLIVLVTKALVVFGVSSAFGYKGKTAIAVSFGLSQVGEFAFVIFSSAMVLHLLSSQEISIGISVTLLTLLISPILYDWSVPFWQRIRKVTAGSAALSKLFLAGEPREPGQVEYSNHIIICGYGRVGRWIGKAFEEFGIPFVVVDYNQKVVQDLKNEGTPVLYGDPTEPEVLEAVGIRNSKAVILAIPDRVAQETLIAYVQTVAPNAKIISRAHQDADWEKLKNLKVDKVVQPEFEAAIAIVRNVSESMGKSKEEISTVTKSMRLSHSR
jgi:CPA2 family monovalent cation:H+ antiporter-2